MSDRPDNKHPIGPGISPLVNSGPAPENEIDPAPQIGVGGTSDTLNRSYFYNVPYPVLLRDCFAGQALPEALRDYWVANFINRAVKVK